MDVTSTKVCGSCLATLRKECGLTQVELAARLQVPQSFVSKIETGERALKVHELFGYAQSLGLSPERLVARLGKTLNEHR